MVEARRPPDLDRGWSIEILSSGGVPHKRDDIPVRDGQPDSSLL
jgi:hypothetical protein